MARHSLSVSENSADNYSGGNAEYTRNRKELRRGPRGACRHGQGHGRGPIAPPPHPHTLLPLPFYPTDTTGVRSHTELRVCSCDSQSTTSGATVSSLRSSSEKPPEPSSLKNSPVCSKVFLGDSVGFWSLIVCSYRSNAGASGNERRATCRLAGAPAQPDSKSRVTLPGHPGSSS